MYFTASDNSVPSIPLLMIFRSGKYEATSHRRIVELPTKTISPVGGGVGLVCLFVRRHILFPAVAGLLCDR